MSNTPSKAEIEALVKRHGATSYRNRADTQHPAYGFTEDGLNGLIVEVLAKWAAPQQEAQEPAVATLHQIMAAARELHAIDNPDGEPEWAALRQYEVDVWRARAERVLKAAAARAPADSVLEDAATPECLTCSDHGAVGNSGFDHKTAADFLNGKTISDEAVRNFVAASRWAHDERSALSATLLAMHGVLTSREAEIALLKKALLEAEAAPQQEVQEPVAWLNPWRADQVTTDPDAYGKHGIPLVRQQPAPAPLSDDTKRLDWMDKDAGERVLHVGAYWYTRPTYGQPYRKHKNLRAAIDAAIAAQGGKT